MKKNVKDETGKKGKQSAGRKPSVLNKLLAGDLLIHPAVKRQMGLIVLVVVLVVLYEGNRYACQRETVRIQRLRREVLDLRNESVALSNELVHKSLQSNIERRLTGDNALQPATTAPIVIEP